MKEEPCKPRNINPHREVTDAEMNLIGAIIRQALADLCAPRGKAQVEKDRVTAKWFFDHSPLFKATGLDKDYLIAAYKRGSVYWKKPKEDGEY